MNELVTAGTSGGGRLGEPSKENESKLREGDESVVCDVSAEIGEILASNGNAVRCWLVVGLCMLCSWPWLSIVVQLTSDKRRCERPGPHTSAGERNAGVNWPSAFQSTVGLASAAA